MSLVYTGNVGLLDFSCFLQWIQEKSGAPDPISMFSGSEGDDILLFVSKMVNFLIGQYEENNYLTSH